MEPPICPHCGGAAELVTGKRIYPHRLDLHQKRFWLCELCDAYCGCHRNTSRPLGTLANRETRNARKRAHSMFDPIWKSKQMTRTAAYAWLSKQTEIKRNKCHIGMMNVEQCELVVEAVRKLRSQP